MIKTLSTELVIDLYRNSEELLLVLDADKNIVFLNNSAKYLFKNIKNIKEIENFFSFNTCVLDKERFFDYNPIQELMSSNVSFVAETLFQIDTDLYRNLNIRSFSLEDKKIVIMSDITEKVQNNVLRELVGGNEKYIEKLEKENKEFSQLEEKARTLAIRTGLINRISAKIRDSFDIDEIIQTVVEEISKTLDLSNGYYSENVSESKYTENSFSIAIPVIYHGEIFGKLMFSKPSGGNKFHPEEISLIEGIASQLASAINQAKLYNELEKQKLDLENALSELKQAQIQLVQSEKMASLGQLVAGVAHEINTPIGSINSNNDIFDKCIKKIKQNPQDTEKFSSIMEDTIKINFEAIKRINAIVKALKNFARLDEAEYKETDIHECIKNTLMLINHEIKGRIEVVEDFGELPLINCYPNLLNQVFMNILVNACQSIEKEGKIIIKTEKSPDKVRIIVSDTGKGISEEHLERIFDPGFTTKGVGVGTGLGLSICYRIIKKHNGTISVESELGKGSKFTIELPNLFDFK